MVNPDTMLLNGQFERLLMAMVMTFAGIRRTRLATTLTSSTFITALKQTVRLAHAARLACNSTRRLRALS
jgi:hypothetical protein